MTTTNEPKYKIENGRLVNRQSGEPIPEDEPIFILRGKDTNAAGAIAFYYRGVENDEHRRAVALRLNQFNEFAALNSNRMKEPDTTLTDDWPKES